MSQTLAQIFAANPTTIVQDTDLYYLVQSPYTPGTDAAITGASLKAAFGSGGTINAGLANQIAFYPANGTTLSGLTGGNDGVLITSALGVPSISSTLPAAVQDNITRLGTQVELLNMGGFRITNMADGIAATDAATVGQVTAVASPLTTKGDLFTFTTVNARLPVALGDGKILQVDSTTATGLSYSTPTYPNLSGTAGTLLRSNGTNNIYSTSTFADTYASSSLLFSSGANTVVGLATANNGLLVTSNTGVPSILAGPGATGRILQSNAAAAPSFSTAAYPSTAGAVGNVVTSDGTNFVSSPPASVSVNAYEAQGRLTLTTNVPVTSSDVTAATTLFYTPYVGDHIALFDGVSTWTTITFTQLSIAVPATTNTMYDAFVFNNAGTATLELTAWTNDTTRATALVYQNGILVRSGATTRRYAGSFRTTGVSGQTEDSLLKRYNWNYYNRVVRPMRAIDTTDSWSYSTAVFRQANANTANQLDFVVGVSEDNVYASVVHYAISSSATSRAIVAGIGLDSTTVQSAVISSISNITNGSSNLPFQIPMTSFFNNLIAIGRHVLVWIERGAGSDTQTWTGDGGSPNFQTGITGFIKG